METWTKNFRKVSLAYVLVPINILVTVDHSENEDHGIWSHHFMADRWGKVQTVTDFILGGSKITADGDYSHEIKSA